MLAPGGDAAPYRGVASSLPSGQDVSFRAAVAVSRPGTRVRSDSVIRVEHLVKVFGHEPERALPMLEAGRSKADIREETGLTVGVNDVSFALDPGEVFVIMGLSGSGKSTLMRCVNRLIEPLSGKVLLTTDDGEIDVTALSAPELRALRRERMSMVFQRFGLFPHRTVLDNVAYGQEVRGSPRE